MDLERFRELDKLRKFVGGCLLSVGTEYIDIEFSSSDCVRIIKSMFPNLSEEDMILWVVAERNKMDISTVKRQYLIFSKNHSKSNSSNHIYSSKTWTSKVFGIKKSKLAKGIRTQSELDNERLTEIVDAIVRYRNEAFAVPIEWIEEYNAIIERVRNNPK